MADVLQIKLETTGDGKIKASLAGVSKGIDSVGANADKAGAKLGSLKSIVTTGDGKIKASLAGVSKGIDSVGANADKAGAKLGSLKSIVGAVGLGALSAKIFGTVTSFESLRASLETVTGSAAAARAAFSEIQSFAEETPFQVDQITEAYIRLKSLGLDPSTDSLRSYGNTASAMNRDILQFIEAVADASTGEFERLKDFGVKAKTEGDKVTFLFQGMRTTVGNNARDIEAYLKSIGDVQFAGGMDRQMDTLRGATSNLLDSIDTLIDKLSSESGLTGALTVATNTLAGFFKAVAGNQSLEQMGKNLAGINKTLEEGNYHIGNRAYLLERQAELEAQIREELQKRGGINALQIEYENLGEQIEELEAKEARLQERYEQPLVGRLYTNSLTQTQQDLENLRKKQAELEEQLLDWEQPDTTGPTATPDTGESSAVMKLIQQLEEEAATYGMSAEQIRLYKLQKEGATAATLAHAEALMASIEKEDEFESAVRASEEAVKSENAAYQDWLNTLRDEGAQVYRDTRTDQEDLATEIERLNRLLEAGVIDWDTYSRAIFNAEEQLNGLGESGDKTMIDLQNAVTGWASGFSATLADMVWGAETSFDDIARSFGKMLTQMVIQKQIVEPFLSSFGFGGSSAAPSAKGNVFSGGAITPFATGGVVSKPTFFPMANGGVGLMGEAGPEAIMPLTRLPNGDLGVQAQGSGGGGVTVQVIDQRRSGEAVSVESTSGQDGQEVIRVMIRDELKSATLDGSMDRVYRDVYGLRRQGVR